MEIDLRQVVRSLLRWAWMIVLLVVLGGLAGYGLASLQTPSYSATTSLLVTTPLSSTLVESANRAETYRNLVESGPVLDRVILELGLEHDREELRENIEASVVPNTQIIHITVTDESAERAADIANSTARNFESQVAELTVGQLERNLDELQAESNGLRERLQEIEAQLAEIDVDDSAEDPVTQSELAALQGERLRLQQTLADLDSSIRSINEQLVTSTTPVAVADAAVVSEEPESPRPLLIGVLGAFLGGLIGLGLIAILELMDTRLRFDDDVEELTGSRILTVVPRADGPGRTGLAAIDVPNAAETDSVRMLRAHLASQIFRGGRQVLVFASPDGEAPTSQLVGNLGVLMAQSGIRTLAIDVNVREPQLHSHLGVSNDTGLTDFLKGEGEVSPLQTNIPDLSVVPAGTGNDNVSEMLGSSRFADLVAAARKEAEVVLISAPALLRYSETLSAAAISDGLVLVVRVGETQRERMQLAAETIRDDDLNLLGTVVVGR